MTERIGFYICECGINIASKVRCGEVAKYIGMFPGVAVSREYLFMCSDPGQEIIEKDIREHGLTRVVVASCSPRMHENTFRAATARGGLNPYKAFHHVCVREHVSWVHTDEDEATAKAKVLCRAGIRRVVEQTALQPEYVKVSPNALVVGGGIAGMQAALDIASAGYQVYLVEKSPTIGGHMLQFDKTFPTLDCAACIGTPKMVSVGQSKKIDLLSYSEVEKFSGFIGNYRVQVRKKTRYIDPNKCTGCGDCVKVCPVEKPNEWDVGTSLRRAIYRPFAQAVPITYAIDKSDRAPCVQTCPAGTNVQGYIALIKEGKYLQAVQIIMEHLPFPGTLGRVCPAPCQAECRRKEVDQSLAIRSLKRFASDQVDLDQMTLPEIIKKGSDQRIAVIGSGPAGLSAAYFLARMGYPVTVFEALSVAGGMLRSGIPDYRLPPAVLDKEIGFMRRLGVDIRLNTPIGSDLTVDRLFEDGFRAVFAATGTQTDVRLGVENEGAEGVVSGICWLKQVNLNGSAEIALDILVIGGGAVAMDVARTARRLGAKEVKVFCLEQMTEMPAWEDEISAALEEGIDIVNGWGPKRFLAEDGRVTGIEFKRCSRVFNEKGKFAPEYDERTTCEVNCSMVIVAIGQKPDSGWTTGSKGLPLDNRGYCLADPVTFATARPGLFAGGELYTGPSIVVQAVANGHEAAISIDRFLCGENLCKGRPERPTGKNWNAIPEGLRKSAQAKMPQLSCLERENFSEVELGFSEAQAKAEATRCIACGTCSECLLCVSQCKAQAIDHARQDERVEFEVGSAIIATGFETMDPTPLQEYGYGKFPNVLTNLEFERLCNATGPTGGKILMRDLEERYTYTAPPKSVAILHCVGSRDERHQSYCSNVCCMYALKFAHLIKDRIGAEVYNFYIDLRCVGKGYEDFYHRLLKEEVRFIRGRAASVTDFALNEDESGKLVVRVEDTLIGQVRRIPVDMVILCTAMEPNKDAVDTARLFGISTGNDGFFLEEHPKLEPVSTSTAGVFVAGACHGPKDIPYSVAQAKAAASMAQALISKGEVEVSPFVSSIDPEICSGCRVCIAVCPYSSIEFDVRHHRSVVNGAVCKGCGSCAAHCPSGAAKVRHFTDRQIFNEIDGLLAEARAFAC